MRQAANRILLLVVTALPCALIADELPSQIDLKASYCLTVVQKQIGMVNEDIPKFRNYPTIYPQLVDGLKKLNENLRRLQLYLVPRMSYLDPIGLLAARKRAEEDFEQISRDSDRCLKSCPDVQCQLNCDHSESEDASTRIRSCKDLSFLPF